LRAHYGNGPRPARVKLGPLDLVETRILTEPVDRTEQLAASRTSAWGEMEIRIESLISGATDAVGTTVIIDVFRAFTTAAVALSRGARRIVMVDTLEKALALRRSGTGDYCIGERDSVKPPGFDFGNSPAELTRADVIGKTLIQTTSNGTAGINAACGADRIYAGAFVTAKATVQAISRHAPTVVTLVAIGRSNGTVRADEDELCGLYLRACLEDRQPDVAAVRALVATMPPPANAKLIAEGAYDPKDREIAAQVDAMAFAIVVRRDGGLLIAEAER
jgi:2-phosphosulfolactate phosphatase